MPYINRPRRVVIDRFIDDLLSDINNALYDLGEADLTNGDMNYIVSRLVHSWALQRPTSYANLSQANSILADASQEFYRTVVAPYEDLKAFENGKVSELDTRKLGV